MDELDICALIISTLRSKSVNLNPVIVIFESSPPPAEIGFTWNPYEYENENENECHRI